MNTDLTQAAISQAQEIVALHQIPMLDALSLVKHSGLIGSLEHIYKSIDDVATSLESIRVVLGKLNGKVF